MWYFNFIVFWLFFTYFATTLHLTVRGRIRKRRILKEMEALWQAPLPVYKPGSYGNPTQAVSKSNAKEVRPAPAQSSSQCEGHSDIADAVVCASCRSGNCTCEGCKRIKRGEAPPYEAHVRASMIRADKIDARAITATFISDAPILGIPNITEPQRRSEDRGTRIAREIAARKMQKFYGNTIYGGRK